MDEMKEHQTIANEILFLRYVQLDSGEASKIGRTPLTITKRIINPGKTEFGFTVIWTHPPKIDEVEKGSPAENAGILPGDFIIFVDKNNVVDMQEEEIINLIRYYGGLLTLEIFRKTTPTNGIVPKKGHGKKINLISSILISPPTIGASAIGSFSGGYNSQSILNSKVLQQLTGIHNNAAITSLLPANLLKIDHRSGNTLTDEMKEQQKLADEFSFLRHLKLDPKEMLQNGRTPLTLTKVLINSGKIEFGFSVIWTHPPRINKVEKGSPAEIAGLLVDDFIIFVDENNVVDMKEEEVSDLFVCCGNMLTLEIFRKAPSKNNKNTECEIDATTTPDTISSSSYEKYSTNTYVGYSR